MPRKRRIAKLRTAPFEYNEECALFLQSGYDYFNAEPFGDPPDMSLIRDCWRDHGDEILADFVASRPGSRPWGWWEFSAPEPRGEDQSETEYLDRWGLWLPGEHEMTQKRNRENDDAESDD